MTTALEAPGGLSVEEAARRHEREGANMVPPPRSTPAWRLMLAQLTHFFAGMLWIAALLALVAGMQSLAVAVAVIVLLNGVFAFAQEHKADRAAAQLGSLMPAVTRVRRGGETLSVQVSDLVLDDLVLLEAGDRIGADLRITESHDLSVDAHRRERSPAPRDRQ